MVTAPVISPVGEPQYGELKTLVEMYYEIQRFRVRGTNRIKALERGATSAERLSLAIKEFSRIEKGLIPALKDAVEDEPVYPWLINQRGIGPVMAAALIASGLDPNIDKPSAWWRFAGCGMVDGKNQRLRRGMKRSYNGFLGRTLHVLVGQFLKAHQPPEKPSFYADLYYQFKEESKRRREELIDIHHHKRAVMLTQRVFMTHLQQKWREALGMTPPRSLYVVEKEPGIHHVIPAPD